MVEFIDPKASWRKLPEDTKEACNCEVGTLMWISGGGCGKKAAYELALGTMTMRSCLDHHREFLRGQEKIGKVQWIEKRLPGGIIQFIRHDPYADPPRPHE